MKNLTIIRPMPFEKPDILQHPNQFGTDPILLKNYQQINITVENLIKTNFMIL